RAADKSVKRIKEKMKAMLPRNSAQQVEAKMVRLEAIIRGWVQYFQLGAIKSICKRLDELLRSRVRKRGALPLAIRDYALSGICRVGPKGGVIH
ncbi:MAG: hypothetical protein JSS78_01800, partial [Bacteroidetes bacterium]|nr:hypothetical protein [Bacteroidota bacterium]